MMTLIILLGLIFSIVDGVMKSWGDHGLPYPPSRAGLDLKHKLTNTHRVATVYEEGIDDPCSPDGNSFLIQATAQGGSTTCLC